MENYLKQFKSSGLYRVVFDKSDIPADIDTTKLRLVVGYSDKGRFNVPVLCTSAAEFRAEFGKANRKLENYGDYFHRTALQAITSGPILALNLKKFSTEKVGAISFDVQADSTIATAYIPAKSVFDTSRFWIVDSAKLSSAEFYNAEGTKEKDYGKYITISAADEKAVSETVFMRRASVSGYDITLQEYFTMIGEDVPDYVDTADLDSLVSDYFAEIYVFKGKFTPALAKTDAFKAYFDVVGDNVYLKPYIINGFGKKTDTLDALTDNETAGFVNKYTGTVLPYMKSSADGGYISLDVIFNQDYASHRLLLNFNTDKLYGNGGELKSGNLILNGFNKISIKSEGKVSAEGNILNLKLGDVTVEDNINAVDQDMSVYSPQTTLKEASVIKESFVVKGLEITKDKQNVVSLVESGDILKGVTVAGVNITYKSETYTPVPDETVTLVSGKIYKIKTYTTETSGVTPEYIYKIVPDATTTDATDYNYTTAPPTKVYTLTLAGPSDTSDVNSAKWIFTDSEGNTHTVADGTLKIKYVDESDVVLSITAGTPKIYYAALVDKAYILYDSKAATLTVGDTDKKTITSDYALSSLEVGQLFCGCLATGAQDKGVQAELVGITAENGTYVYTFDNAIYVGGGDNKNILYRLKNSVIDNLNEEQMQPVYLEGYTYQNVINTSKAITDEVKLAWINTILSVMSEEEGIRIALTDNKTVDYRYIVDGFMSFPDVELKKELFLICKEKENAFAIVNFPSVNTFRDCTYASYTDADNVFQVKYIADGNNRKKPATNKFTVCTDINGASFGAYYTPVTITDGYVKSVIPSAGLVSNDFMAKYSTYHPYDIVAGPKRGRITASELVGPDYNYSRAELDILEPLGVNCIIYSPTYGTYINSNKTAKQNPVTGLSLVNVREVVIYLMDEIAVMLQGYQWEFNTPELRALVKGKADTICEQVKLNGGLQVYSNQCDDSNNTSDIIDNEMLILDTNIEPGKGCGKIVHRLTIYRTGGMSSSVSK